VCTELVLLTRSARTWGNRVDKNFLQLACDSLTDIIRSKLAVFVERIVDGDRRFVVAAGSG
jgi:hypothetical protein